MLNFCDSFDSYAASGDLTKKWSVVGTGWGWVSGAGRFGGGAVSNAGGASGNLLQTAVGTLLTTQNPQALGAYFKFSGNPAALTQFVRWYGSSGAAVMSLRLTTAGLVASYDGNDGTLRMTSTTVVTDGNFHWIEVLEVNNSSWAMYIDGISQGTGAAFNGNNVDHFALYSISGVTVTVDDLIHYDGQAGAPINTNFPLGARQITCIRPASDNAVSFSVLSSGTTHFNLVNEVSPNGDTSYCQDGTSGNQDLFNMGTLGYTPTNINVVMANLYLDNPSGGTINSQAVCKNGATTTVGTSKVTPATYQTMQWPFPTDPNTGAAWTPSGLGAALFGYKNP